MEVYRISKKEFANLDGLGGLYYPGRWHNTGYRVIYASQNRSLAVLEYLVHLNNVGFLNSDFVISSIEIPDNVDFDTIQLSDLQPDWKIIQRSSITRKIGSDFLKATKNLYLKVPSAIIEEENNYIINPSHPLMSYGKITNISAFSFDQRLVK